MNSCDFAIECFSVHLLVHSLVHTVNSHPQNGPKHTNKNCDEVEITLHEISRVFSDKEDKESHGAVGGADGHSQSELLCSSVEVLSYLRSDGSSLKLRRVFVSSFVFGFVLVDLCQILYNYPQAPSFRKIVQGLPKHFVRRAKLPDTNIKHQTILTPR